MESTLDLLARAVAGAPSERQLAFDLGLSEAALRKARERGNLSPPIAAHIAKHMKENIAFWTLLAVAENSKDTVIRRAAEALRHLCITHPRAWLRALPSRLGLRRSSACLTALG